MSRDLVVTAGSGTELSLSNADFSAVFRGCDNLRATIEPDIYRLSVRAGNASIDYDLVVTESAAKLLPAQTAAQTAHSLDASNDAWSANPPPVVTSDASGVRVQMAPPRFTSAAPLYDTGKSHEYQSAFVAEVSERHSYQLGHGGSILLVSRTWRRDPKRPLIDPSKGVTVHDAEGKQIADLQTVGEHSKQGDDPAVACRIDVDPGWYRLRVAREGMPVVEQALVVSRDWQTQVFLLRQPSGDRAHDRLKMSLMLRTLESGARQGRLFEPTDEAQRRTELALQGLQRGRQVMSRDQLRGLLAQKFFDPMLGLLAGHQIEDGEDEALLREVIHNLRRLLPGHPDVEALALRVPELSQGARFPFPPMLTAGWRNIVGRSAIDPEAVPAGSMTEQIAARLYGVGVWLWWSADEKSGSWARPYAKTQRPPELESLNASPLRQLIKRGVSAPVQSSSPHGLALQSMLMGSVDDSNDAALVEQQVIRALGVPRSLVESTAQDVLDALGSVKRALAPVAKKAKNVVTKVSPARKASPKKAAAKKAPAPRPVAAKKAAKKAAAKKPAAKKSSFAKKAAFAKKSTAKKS